MPRFTTDPSCLKNSKLKIEACAGEKGGQLKSFTFENLLILSNDTILQIKTWNSF